MNFEGDSVVAKYIPIDLSPYELRIASIENGHNPTPCDGKRPILSKWQDIFATKEMVGGWGGSNTGLLTKFGPALDIDILDPTAAQIVEDVARNYLRGRVLVRMGQEPKRAIPLRTDTPFKKITRKLVAPDGSRHKIEVLCDGQQFIIGGDHPDTNRPYGWQDGMSPANTRREELPPADDIEIFLDLCVAELKEKLDWAEPTSGSAEEFEFDAAERPPLDERIKATSYKGEHGINQALLELPIARLSEGTPVLEVIAECEDLVRRVWEQLDNDHPHKDTWDWAAQHRQIEDSVYGFIKLRCGENPRLTGALPNDLLTKWREIEQRGGSPGLYKKRGLGRGAWGVKDFGPAEEIPTVDPEEIPTQPKEERTKPGAPFILRPRGLIDPSGIPVRKWLGGGEFYQRRTVSVTFAPGDFGKTTLGMTEAVSMNTMRDLLGDHPDEKLRVWIHNGEDTNDEIDRRLAAICQQYEIPLGEIADLFVTTAADIPLRVASGYGEVTLDKPLIKCIYEQICDNKIDVAIFDPLVTLHGVPEGDNSKMDRVIRVFTGIADASDCSLGLHHHNRKGPAGEEYEYGVDDGRGASAIKDAARAARVLNRMKEKQADDLGIPAHERSAYIRIDRAKGNNSPTRQPRWVTFKNVDLPQGDAVGVLVPWNPPASGSPEATAANQIADTVFLAVLFRFNTEGRRASDRKGVNFAPRLFFKEREARQAKIGKTALEVAMRRLLASDRIELVDDFQAGKFFHELRVKS